MPQNQQSAMTMSHISSATALMFWGNFFAHALPLALADFTDPSYVTI